VRDVEEANYPYSGKAIFPVFFSPFRGFCCGGLATVHSLFSRTGKIFIFSNDGINPVLSPRSSDSREVPSTPFRPSFYALGGGGGVLGGGWDLRYSFEVLRTDLFNGVRSSTLLPTEKQFREFWYLAHPSHFLHGHVGIAFRPGSLIGVLPTPSPPRTLYYVRIRTRKTVHKTGQYLPLLRGRAAYKPPSFPQDFLDFH